MSIDGEMVAPEQAKVSVLDRGFLYGDGVLETVRTYGGEPFALEEHVERLATSAQLLGFELPVREEVIEREIRAAVRAAGNEESVVRVLVTRGEGLGLMPPEEPSPLRVIVVEAMPPIARAMYRDGVTVVTDRAASPVPGAKVMSYLASLMAVRRARAAGAHEALLLDAEGYVLEGATSNFFLVIEGALVTAPKGEVLAGVTRSRVLSIAGRLG
ncbi:MAG: aminotransferase class IV, partial [Polyangiaceae bacterium]